MQFPGDNKGQWKLNKEENMQREKSDVQFSSVAQLFLSLCNPMDCNTPGLPVHHQLLAFTQTHVC